MVRGVSAKPDEDFYYVVSFCKLQSHELIHKVTHEQAKLPTIESQTSISPSMNLFYQSL
jgi:hypothetical protein